MKQEILTHLRNNKPYAGRTLADFLKREKGDYTQQEVKDAIRDLIDEESIIGSEETPSILFNDNELTRLMSEYRGRFDGIRITWQGERRWEDVEVFTRDKNLNKSLIKTNNFQRRATALTIVVAALSLAAIVVTACIARNGVTSHDMQGLKQQMKENSTILDSIRAHEAGIDALLQKVASDNLPRKSH